MARAIVGVGAAAVELRYELRGGTDSAEILVLHHGHQASAESWSALAEQVSSPELAVLSFDCRGARRSGGALLDESMYSIEQLADVVESSDCAHMYSVSTIFVQDIYSAT